MKDVGELKKLNLNANQKRVKDTKKPLNFLDDCSPAKTAKKFKKIKAKMKKK